jgi:hypothetical protein
LFDEVPFDWERMRERNLLDDIDEIEQAVRQTPSVRFAARDASRQPGCPILDRLEDLRHAPPYRGEHRTPRGRRSGHGARSLA